MAYNTIYNATWRTKNRQGAITILKKDYAGTPTFPLRTKSESVEVSYLFRGWDNHIVGMNASFAFQNNSVGMSAHLLALMNAEEQEYKVRITETSPGSYTLFEGYMNNELIEQPYVGYSHLFLTASSYLSKLQYDHPVSIDTLQNLSFIDLIDDVLTKTGAAFDIRISCSLYETSFPINSAGTQTLFNLYGVYTELFWENNIDRRSGLEILQMILSTFECYLYWFDGYWYIERYEDIWSTSKDFVTYTTGVSYEPADAGTLDNQTPSSSDLHALTFVELSQMLSTRPGKNKVEITLKESKLYNLTINDFTDAVEIYTLPLSYDLSLRHWEYYDDGYSAWPEKGIQYKNISNGIQRTGLIPGSRAIGIYTKVRVTVGSGTSLNLKWKFATEPGTVPGSFADPEDLTCTFRYFLKIGTEFIIYDDVDEQWELTSGATAYSGKEQEIEVSGEEFDLDLYSYEIQATIPLGDVVGLADGEHDIIVMIGKESFETSSLGPENSTHCVMGDVKITISEDFPDNVVEGTVSNDYLGKVKPIMELFDLANWNYKNGVLCGTDYDTLSETWSDGDHTDTLARMKLISKWRQNHRTMQMVSGRVYDYTRMRPFQMFTDSEQTRVFVLGSFTDMLDQDMKRVELVEYDNTETITLT